ncbi:MAG: zinc-binding dehydrogenase [Candidatus Kapaibacterium sp.]
MPETTATTMQAAVLHESPQGLRVQDVLIPGVPAGHVRVRMEAAALNRRDVWISQGQYAGIVYPSVLGSDGAGVIDVLGSDVPDDYLGMHVVINPSLNWGENSRAQSADYSILGMPVQGTFAEYVVVPFGQCHALPGHLTMVQGAAVPLAGLTAYRAVVTQGNVRSGEHVLVTGAGGGVSSWAVQFARVLGATVNVTTRHEATLEAALQAGAHGGMCIGAKSWTKEYVARFGMPDCIIDSIGGDFMNHLVNLCAPGGTIVSYGATLGAVPSFEIRRVFWKQIRLVGSTMGTAEEFSAMMDMISMHKLLPVVDSVLPLASIDQAFARMRECEHSGKIVLRINT